MFINEYGDKNNPLFLLLAPMMISGFSEVTSDHHPSKPWITVLARK